MGCNPGAPHGIVDEIFGINTGNLFFRGASMNVLRWARGYRTHCYVVLAAGFLAGQPIPEQKLPARLEMTISLPDYRLEYFPRAHVPGQRPLVLALGGGAAKGIAHVGVLQRLQEEGFAIDGIVGTSMGACIGSMYASGYSGPSLQDLLEKVDLGALLLDRQHRFPGETLWEQENERTTFLSLDYKPGVGFSFSPGTSPGLDLKRALQILLSRGLMYADDSFDNLRVPFRAVSTNLQTGRASVPGSGDLVTAVRASMCVPGLFSPVLIENQQHVDGMLVQNLPVELARSRFPGSIIVAVEVGRGLEAVRQNSILGIAFRSLDVSIEERTELSRKAADVLLRPRTEKIPHLEFHELVGTAVREGRDSVDRSLDEIEDRVYGPAGAVAAPGGPLRIQAPDGIRERLAEIAVGTLPGGDRAIRHYLRLLRRVHATGLAQKAEIRFSGEAATLVVEPFPLLRKIVVQASPEWRQLISEDMAQAGVKEGATFNPVAFGRALDAFFLQATFQGRPLVDVMGTRFDPESGALLVCVGENKLDRIRIAGGILSRGQTSYLSALLKPFEGEPLDAKVLAKNLLLAEKRLGLEELRMEADPNGSGQGILVTPIPDEKVVLDAALAYESTWQTQGSINVHVNRIWGSDFNAGLNIGTNKLWSGVGMHVARVLGRWPRLGVEASGELFEHHFISGGFHSPFLVDPEVTRLDGRTLREQKVEVGVFMRYGVDDRGLISVNGSRSWTSIQPDLPSSSRTRMDQIQLRMEWDSFDRYLFPTEGLLIRVRVGQGWQNENGPQTRAYQFAYVRTRHLWRLGNPVSLEEDLEAGLGRDVPLARWYSVGGPAFLSGSPSAGFLTQNFAMFRLGLPLHVTKQFGWNVQVVPRIDAGYLGAGKAERIRGGAFVKGGGVSLRSEIGRWFCEVAVGRWYSSEPTSHEKARINILFGAHPFDLWRRR